MLMVKLTVEFDGGGYVGWQVQPNGASIQAALEAALLRLTGEVIRVRGSSRTDAGVHALGLVAAFQTDSTIPIENFALALNSRLPKDIAVRKAEFVADTFDPRRMARRKCYRYQLLNSPIRSALERGRVWHVKQPLDYAKMQDAAAQFVGAHDFTSFGNQERNTADADNVRTIERAEFSRAGEFIIFEIVGRSFIYNMVRNIVGTLVDVGAGRFTPEDISALFAVKDRQQAGRGAPAHGLTLVSVEYDSAE